MKPWVYETHENSLYLRLSFNKLMTHDMISSVGASPDSSNAKSESAWVESESIGPKSESTRYESWAHRARVRIRRVWVRVQWVWVPVWVQKMWVESRLESSFNRVQSSPCFCYFIIFLSYQTFPSKYMGHLAFIVRDRVTEDDHHLSPEINGTFWIGLQPHHWWTYSMHALFGQKKVCLRNPCS